MPAAPIIMAGAAIVGAGAAVVGTIQSNRNARAANAQQQEALKFQRQQQQLQGTRQRIDSVRSARDAYARVQQAAENQGVAASSVAQGGAGSIVSQMNSNLSFLDKYDFLSDQASRALGKAMEYEGRASMWGSIGNFGFQLFGAAGGFGSFKGPTPPPAPKAP
jgi:hypothetical protein